MSEQVSALEKADYKSYSEWMRSKRYKELMERKSYHEKNPKMSGRVRELHHSR